MVESFGPGPTALHNRHCMKYTGKGMNGKFFVKEKLNSLVTLGIADTAEVFRRFVKENLQGDMDSGSYIVAVIPVLCTFRLHAYLELLRELV